MPRPIGPRPAQFIREDAARKIVVKEPSDVVSLGGDRFLAVGDKSARAALIDGRGQSRVELPGLERGRSGLEAVAYDPGRQNLFVASEEEKKLYRYKFDPSSPGAQLEKTYELDLGGARNKGVEGLAFLPQQWSPTGRDQLVVANEGSPRVLALLDANGAGKTREIKLDPAIRKACADFSGLAVDPRTGHLFLSSDESATVVELVLLGKGRNVRAELVQAIPLRDGAGSPLEKVEGISFDDAGNLYVLQEQRRTLLRFTRLG